MQKKIREKLISYFILFTIILVIVFFVVLGYLVHKETSNELFEGTPAEEFCTKKCGDKDLIYSNNNTNYGFVRCECVGKLTHGEGKVFPVARIETFEVFFDSQNLEEVDREEILERINK